MRAGWEILRSGAVRLLTFVVVSAALSSCGGNAGGQSPTTPVSPPTPSSGLRATYVILDGRVGTGSGSVLRLSPDGTLSTIATIAGSASDVTTDGAGTMFVVSSLNASVLRITPSGSVSTVFSGLPLTGPIAIALDRAGNIIVGDNALDAVFRITPDGQSITEVLKLPPVPPFLQGIELGRDAAGDVIVATTDAFDRAVVMSLRLDGSSSTLLTSGFSSISGMVVEPDGNLVVADFVQRAIVRITPGGNITFIAGGAQLCCNLVGLAQDPTTGDFVAFLNFSSSILRITHGGTISTVHTGAPLTFPNAITVLNR